MGLIKEYVDRAIQTEVPSPYFDPAVVLAAPPLTRRGPLSPDAYTLPRSPTSPIMAPLASRRLPNRRCPPNEAVNRRIVSMPENRSEPLSLLSQIHGKRVVSMPTRVRQELEPSVELFHSPSTSNSDSFGSYGGRRERVRVFRAPSDIPQTPSPPSSPESLLIIAAGTQLPDGFLRRKYSPEPLIEEDEGNSHAYIQGSSRIAAIRIRLRLDHMGKLSPPPDTRSPRAPLFTICQMPIVSRTASLY